MNRTVGIKEKIKISLTNVAKGTRQIFIQDGTKRIQKVGSVKYVK